MKCWKNDTHTDFFDTHMSVKDKLEQFFKNNNIKYTTYIDFGEPF